MASHSLTRLARVEMSFKSLRSQHAASLGKDEDRLSHAKVGTTSHASTLNVLQLEVRLGWQPFTPHLMLLCLERHTDNKRQVADASQEISLTRIAHCSPPPFPLRGLEYGI